MEAGSLRNRMSRSPYFTINGSSREAKKREHPGSPCRPARPRSWLSMRPQEISVHPFDVPYQVIKVILGRGQAHVQGNVSELSLLVDDEGFLGAELDQECAKKTLIID